MGERIDNVDTRIFVLQPSHSEQTPSPPPRPYKQSLKLFTFATRDDILAKVLATTLRSRTRYLGAGGLGKGGADRTKLDVGEDNGSVGSGRLDITGRTTVCWAR